MLARSRGRIQSQRHGGTSADFSAEMGGAIKGWQELFKVLMGRGFHQEYFILLGKQLGLKELWRSLNHATTQRIHPHYARAGRNTNGNHTQRTGRGRSRVGEVAHWTLVEEEQCLG